MVFDALNAEIASHSPTVYKYLRDCTAMNYFFFPNYFRNSAVEMVKTVL